MQQNTMPKGTRVKWNCRNPRYGVILAFGRSTKSDRNVYLVKPDDGLGQTVAMPNGEVFQAVEVHPRCVSRA